MTARFDPDEDFLADLRIGNTGAGTYIPDYHRAEAERRMAARAGVTIAEVVDEMHARDREDEIRGEGYVMAQEEVEAILNGKGSAAVKLRAIREWAEAGRKE